MHYPAPAYGQCGPAGSYPLPAHGMSQCCCGILPPAGVSLENIISSKKEIEDTIDTLNLAFEKLLDSLFQDTAWDVSSDISVLHTMLAQEGLTEDGLKK